MAKHNNTNPVVHGLFAKHTVLPWEDAAQYEQLLAGLQQDYQPKTITQHVLVQELAGIVFRKARLAQAEHTAHMQQLHAATSGYDPDFKLIQEAIILQPDGKQVLPEHITLGITLVRQALHHQPADNAAAICELEEIIASGKVIVAHNGDYTALLALLDAENREAWDEWLQVYSNGHKNSLLIIANGKRHSWQRYQRYRRMPMLVHLA